MSEKITKRMWKNADRQTNKHDEKCYDDDKEQNGKKMGNERRKSGG